MKSSIPLAVVLLASVLWTGLSPAQGADVERAKDAKDLTLSQYVFDEQWYSHNDVKVTARLAQMAWIKLAQRGWTPDEMQQALAISRRDRALFELYVEQRDAGVPPEALQESFALAKGSAALAREYWGYIQKSGFPLEEIRTIFEAFPEQYNVRSLYVFYRTGGTGDLAKAPPFAPRRRGRQDGPDSERRYSYSRDEVMGIFRRTQGNPAYIQEYFALREKGMPVAHALRPIMIKILADQRAQREKLRAEARSRTDPEPAEHAEEGKPTKDEADPAETESKQHEATGDDADTSAESQGNKADAVEEGSGTQAEDEDHTEEADGEDHTRD